MCPPPHPKRIPIKPKGVKTIAKPHFKKKGFRGRVPADFIRINERIRASKIRVIDGTTNQQLGVMSTGDALRKAKSMGLDLVEVTSKTVPPVCRICDYGKWKYEQAKQKKDKDKTKTQKLKEVKFRINIEDHDYNIKMARGERFLDEGHKLRVQLMFKGRQMAHPEIGMDLMHRIIEDFKTMAHVDAKPRQAGRNIGMMLSPLPKHLRKPKFTAHFSDEHDEEEDHEDHEETHDEPHDEPHDDAQDTDKNPNQDA